MQFLVKGKIYFIFFSKLIYFTQCLIKVSIMAEWLIR